LKFIDEAIISVSSGHGGSGCVSFRREKYIPLGGPDGGNGGDGGNIIFKADPGKRTLHYFKTRRSFAAQNGAPGKGRQQTGKNGQDTIIPIPPGTIITDAETGQVIADMVIANESLTFLKGGRGGKGNKHFTTSTNRSPKFAQPGEPGQSTKIKLELKLLADIGIIGLPNAGKSTLLSVISAARPAIRDYPFTTLSPSLGMVQIKDCEPFAVADIPGLIEGAHTGTGLGIQFLKHIERTRCLVHLIDAAAIDPDDPLHGYRTINNELAMYGKNLEEKPQVVVLNKMDITGATEMAELFVSAAGLEKCFRISAAARKGIDDLKNYLFEIVSKSHEPDPPEHSE
jgi:GTPase